MKTMFHCIMVAFVATLHIGCGSESGSMAEAKPTAPIKGLVNGTDFTPTDQRASDESTVLAVTLMNENVLCGGANTPRDQQVRLKIMIPTSIQSAGVFDFADSGIQVSATTVSMVNDVPQFASIAIAKGTLWLDALASTVQGAVRFERDSQTTIEGSFSAPRCTP